jgi:hypothetical protein
VSKKRISPIARLKIAIGSHQNHACPIFTDAVEAYKYGIKLEDSIIEFCKGQEWAADSWKNQKHIAPLFEIVKGMEARP